MAGTFAFVNGPILTMVGAAGGALAPSLAEVLVIRDGRVVATGSRGLEQAHPDATIVDLGGRSVTPGFIDAHQHPSLAALHPRWAPLRDVTDLDTLRERLVAAAVREPATAWVRGCEWDEMGTGLALTRAELDALGLDRPVIIGCFSYHRAVVCSKGLDALGISASTPDPPNGQIERDARGEPTGLLTEAAWTAAHVASLADFADPDRWGEHLETYLRSLLPMGITAVHDAACPVEAEPIYRGLAVAGRLPVSVLVLPHGPILTGPDPARLAGPPTGEGDEQVRVGPAKFFADGGIELAIDAHLDGHPIHTGAPFAGLAAAMTLAVSRGFGVAVHAMGNTGLRVALDAYREALGPAEPAHRLRIEHVTLAGPAEIADLRALGAAGVVQPAFVDLIGRTIGNLRFDEATWLPYGDLFGAGVLLAASSDGPCTFMDPLRGTHCGATRLTESGQQVGPEQALSTLDWLHLYTAGAADVGEQAAERGRLLPGRRADLVVIDADLADPIFAAGAATEPLTVAETWVAGERVWTRPQPRPLQA